MPKKPAFYNSEISYEENYDLGPPVSRQKLKPPQDKRTSRHEFLGFSVSLPFGIPPGPLLNSKYMQAAFAWGFDVSTYKTVRSQEFPCHPFPNVLPVDIKGELHVDKTPRLVAEKYGTDPKKFNITNSFGVPSKKPNVWQEDVKKSLSYVGDGQLMILSFMGTVKSNQTHNEFAEDLHWQQDLPKTQVLK